MGSMQLSAWPAGTQTLVTSWETRLDRAEPGWLRAHGLTQDPVLPPAQHSPWVRWLLSGSQMPWLPLFCETGLWV